MSVIFKDTNHLYKCYNIVAGKEGLLDMRGYNIDHINNLSYVQLELINQQKPLLHLETTHKNNKNDVMHIIFLADIRQMKKKKKLSEEQNYIANIKNKKDNIFLFVYYKYINVTNVRSQDNNAIREFLTSLELRKFEKFEYKELLHNITDHHLVPKHERIEKDEIEKICKIYNIQNKTDLKKILITDPVVKFYGFDEGDICKITRHNRNTGTTYDFRLVIDKD